MATQIKLRRDTKTAWESANPVLADGELGYDKTSLGIKLGNGTDAWTARPFLMGRSRYMLGECKSKSIIWSGDTNYICWTDPDDVVQNGATLAKWKRTSLVRKTGSYPANETDGTIVAQTAGSTKNSYRVTSFADTGVVQGTTYYYKLFSVTEMDTANDLEANKLPVTNVLSPEMIHSLSQAGTLTNYLNVGDTIVIHHPEFDNSDGYDGQLVQFMGYDCVTPASGSGFSHAAVFQFVDCLFSTTMNYGAMQFDPAEMQYALTADTVAITGKTYYTVDGSTYTALVENTDWTAGQAVPANSWFEKNPNPSYANGTNKWDESLIRQYLNADAPANQWWEPKNLWDVGAYKTRNGFLYNLPFKDILVPIAKKVARSTTYGGASATVTVTDKVFIPSVYETYGTTINNVAEGVRIWDYWSTYSGNSYKIKLRNNEASIWWLSSPHASNGRSTYSVTAAGASSTGGNSDNASGIAPAFAL